MENNDNTHDVNSETKSIFGLCPECNKSNTDYEWCNQCNAKRFQQDWTSGNKYIDNFIQETQFNTQNLYEVLEWIPYNRLTNIKYLAKGGFSTVYKAIWLDGLTDNWNYDARQWNRRLQNVHFSTRDYEVVIKNLNNSSNINEEFLNEVRYLY